MGIKWLDMTENNKDNNVRKFEIIVRNLFSN